MGKNELAPICANPGAGGANGYWPVENLRRLSEKNPSHGGCVG